MCLDGCPGMCVWEAGDGGGVVTILLGEAQGQIPKSHHLRIIPHCVPQDVMFWKISSTKLCHLLDKPFLYKA